MYKIYCYHSPSGKIYIGQTNSTLSQRAGKNGSLYSKCPYFYKAIQKYGFKNFTVEILKDNLTEQEANYWEEYYIREWDATNPDIGYNLARGGSGSHKADYDYIYNLFAEGYNILQIMEITQHCRNTILRALSTHGISQQQIIKRSYEIHYCQYTLTGQFIQKYNSAKEAALAINGCANSIVAAARNKESYNSFFWTTLKLPGEEIDFSQFVVKKEQELYQRRLKNLEDEREKKKALHDKLGEHALSLWQEGKTTGEIAKILEKGTDYISLLLNEKGIDGKERIKRSAGKHLATKVAAYDKEGNKIGEWLSLADAGRELGIQSANISKVLNGERLTAGGYIWKKV